MIKTWPASRPDLGLRAVYKASASDFVVEEVFDPELTGSGEHLWIEILKQDQNTAWVASEYARKLGIAKTAVAWSGLKDRHAITRQWLSLHLPGRQSQDLPEVEGVNVLKKAFHQSKLRIGSHDANCFKLILRQTQGQISDWAERLQTLAQFGFPNYFGPQRFGKNGNNLEAVLEMENSERFPKRRQEKGRYFSVARSLIFNELLAKALASDNWMGKKGLLWGRRHRDAEALSDQERCVQHSYPNICHWLEHAGVNAGERAMQVIPENLQWTWINQTDLQLMFTLPTGAFATSLLSELGHITEAA